nr:transposase [Bradyrhizobium diazoefficiens]
MEVFTGAGRRRKWHNEDKARTIAEIATSGDSVCAAGSAPWVVAQQLFGWRRELREAAVKHSEAQELQFVPAAVDAVAQTATLRPKCKAP